MNISGLQPPPPFLSSPEHPVITWKQWIQAFKNYMVASGASDPPSMRRKAILVNCLGLEGQRIFQTLTAAGETLTHLGPDEFDRAIVTLEDHYKSSVNVTAARHRFRRSAQAPERTQQDSFNLPGCEARVRSARNKKTPKKLQDYVRQ
ncbi:hypothetical protein HPB49_009186 [Dermacentor silvarum]|uniref:Uncharacterized protein n=1 Tax=Dermacentor silvarum TaxID=543639 RepID=A0ACB8CE46_DERSI|nr:hypothetical protein HPB49_009186 [Dermacentor silvarum]